MFVAVGDHFPHINMDNDMKNFLVTNHGFKLNIKISTGHVDQFVLLNLNGFTPSSANASRMFLSSRPKMSNAMSVSMCFHAGLSTTDRIMSSSLTCFV